MKKVSRRTLLKITLAAAASGLLPPAQAATSPVLRPEKFKHYIDAFNAQDEEIYPEAILNADAWPFLRDNIPLFECPDKMLEEIYYFRWWTFRKHIKQTPDGFIITEFLPHVGWSGKYNSINCAAALHFYEGRWLHDTKYLNDYATFWLRKGGSVRSYSFWIADSLWNRYLATNDQSEIKDLLPDLIANYQEWEKSHLKPNGMFWQVDDRDGMEMSVGGNGKKPECRPTINSYMYADARAIANIADLLGRKDVAADFRGRAAKLKGLVQERLWDKEAQFFEVIPVDPPDATWVGVRELIGYTPWYVNLPDAGYEEAWKQLMDPNGFYAPYGPTTAERRSPGFTLAYQGHECQWNGPSWPFSTAVTLTAMANLLNNYRQKIVTKSDYLKILTIYANSHHLKRDDGTVVPWIDEDLNPLTGDWIARTIQKPWTHGTYERGKDYNHSTFCDLIITGLVGLRPRADGVIEVNPLVPDGTWDYFCLDNVLYHGHLLTICYDKTGKQYGRGKGLQVLVDGKKQDKNVRITALTA